jgi:hypothetical protein
VHSFPRLVKIAKDKHSNIFQMHLSRVCLILLHLTSAICALPHLISHITRLSLHTISFRSQIAYLAYWINYCLMVLGILVWLVWVVGRQQTVWQVLEVSGIFLVGQLIYTSFDLTTRILLRHQFIVICFDILHVAVLCPAICLTFLLARQVKRHGCLSRQSESDIDGQ